jgi:hypothetical protein
MFNPLKMSSDEKQMLIGGIATSLIYWGNAIAEEQAGYPTELNQRIDPHLPKNGELLTGIAPPLALYTIVKYGKKERFRSIANGSILFGLPHMTARIICQTAYAEGVAARPAARIVAPATSSKYMASAPSARNMSAGLSKYAITA